MRSVVCALAGLAAVAGAARAEEGDRALSVYAGYGTFTATEDLRPEGLVLGTDYERGLSSSLAWRLSAGGGVYYDVGAAYTGQATIGITYLFDVLKYVPYANLGVGVMLAAGSEIDTELVPLVELGLGLDFLRSREFSWGIQLRFETFANQNSFATAGLRATWRWGFF